MGRTVETDAQLASKPPQPTIQTNHPAIRPHPFLSTGRSIRQQVKMAEKQSATSSIRQDQSIHPIQLQRVAINSNPTIEQVYKTSERPTCSNKFAQKCLQRCS